MPMLKRIEKSCFDQICWFSMHMDLTSSDSIPILFFFFIRVHFKKNMKWFVVSWKEAAINCLHRDKMNFLVKEVPSKAYLESSNIEPLFIYYIKLLIK